MKKPEDYSTNDIWMFVKDANNKTTHIVMRDGTKFKWDEAAQILVDNSIGVDLL